jgi:hypothetical protein
VTDGTSANVVPSIKGVTMLRAVNRLQALLENGKLQQSELEVHLDDDDLQLLDQRIAPTLWYPIDCYERVMLLVRSSEGGVGDGYWVRFGAETAAEAFESKSVQIILTGARAFGPRAGVALIKLSGLFYNFAEWQWEGEITGQFSITARGASAMPELARHGSLGFIQHFAEEFLGRAVPMTSDRPTRDVIIYRTQD